MYFIFCGTHTLRKTTQLYPSNWGFIQVCGGLLYHSYALTLSKYIYQSTYCANMGWYMASHPLVTLNPRCTTFHAKIRVRQTGWTSPGVTSLVGMVDLSYRHKVCRSMFMAHHYTRLHVVVPLHHVSMDDTTCHHRSSTLCTSCTYDDPICKSSFAFK